MKQFKQHKRRKDFIKTREKMKLVEIDFSNIVRNTPNEFLPCSNRLGKN